jgi:dipeptidyl aminopeptidase/acylaminoacyl peptidase
MGNRRERIATRVSVAIFSAVLLLWARSVGGREKQEILTVKDTIETTQVVRPYGADPVLVSPDGSKYLVVLERGDLARNGTWVELFSGSTESLAAARASRVVARLFSRSTASAGDLIKNVRWLDDDEHVTFLWDDGRLPTRVVSVDVQSRKIDTVVGRSMPIVEYDMSPDGRTVVFVTSTPRDLSEDASDERNGFAVVDQSIWALLGGNLDGWTGRLHYDTFVLFRPQGRLYKVRETVGPWSMPPELLELSPDGRYAITVRPVGAVPADWDHYTDHIFRDDYLPLARRNPSGPNLVRQYFVIDTKKGTTRPLWNAPENPAAKVLWSPDSKAVVIGPTFLPVSEADSAGFFGQAVAEVDVETGRFVQIPVSQSPDAYERHPVRWVEDHAIEIGDTTAVFSGRTNALSRFKKIDGRWEPVEDEVSTQARSQKVRFELRENPNTPPSLYAVDERTGSAQEIKELNPQLSRFALGHVELVHWKATDGRPWSGLLYYPVHYQSGRTFPLVIQTHGYIAAQFTLDGVFSTASAAQVLANREIAVLQVGGPDAGGEEFAISPKEPRVYMAGFEGAIDHFVASGLCDRAKVGIVGFSRTGWYVEYMLTHSPYKFAAVIVADNSDCSYLQYVFFEDGGKGEYETDAGARPFGEGLLTWIRSAPAFNADRVNTPLRMEVDTGPIDRILEDWEMFSNLRYLQKPVELFVIPNIQHGVHILQNPAQRVASQEGAVDWFCFWLKGEEDADPGKVRQYRRWRELKDMVAYAVADP